MRVCSISWPLEAVSTLASTGERSAPPLKNFGFAGVSAFLPSIVKAGVFSRSGRHDHCPSAPASAAAAAAATARPGAICTRSGVTIVLLPHPSGHFTSNSATHLLHLMRRVAAVAC